MKKILILILFLGFSAPTFSQEFGYDDIASRTDHFGIKLGLNFSNLNANPDDPNYKTATKFPYLALLSTMKLSDMFLFQGEAGYNLLGANYDLYTNADPIKLSLGYITLGALMKAYFLQDIKLNVLLGIQYGYLIFAQQEDLDRLDNYKTSDFDLLAGIGYDFDFGLIIEMRYLLGLTNVTNLQDIHYSSSIKNSAIQLQFGWLF